MDQAETSSFTIMIVDDTPASLRLLEGMLREQGYRVRAFPRGRLALAAAEREAPDLVLLDVNMPEMNGYELCQRMKERPGLKDVPILFLSAMSETRDKVQAFSVGGVDYVTKPFQFEEVHARVETHLRLRRLQTEIEMHNRHLQELVRAQVKEIADSQMATIFALARLAESRDYDTGRHLERVRTFCGLLAGRLREHPPYQNRLHDSYVDNVFHASPLHDIGKVAIPDSVLLKPGPLTPEEFAVIETHTTRGAETLEAVRREYPKNAFIHTGIEIAQWHHERWDGTGYPSGLSGESIPLSARIMAVVDVYDALRSRRCYKMPYSHAESVEIIREGSASHFDPDVVDAFLSLQETFEEVRDRVPG